MRRPDYLDAARGVVNGVLLGLLFWAILLGFLFYGFRVAL